jgi:uncharacterized membrane protein
MTDSKDNSVIDLSIHERNGTFKVVAPSAGIEVSAESREDALKAFAAELARVQAVMAEQGFQLPFATARGGGGAVEADTPENEAPAKISPYRRISVFWQGVIFTLLVLLGINQLILVPALDRMEKVALYVFGGDGRDPGVRQVGRIAIDRIIDLARATEEITPERREELRKALRTISRNSRPLIDALMSEGAAGEGGTTGTGPSAPKGDGP